MNNTYTGIGARNTPDDILHKMTKISMELAKKGFVLRSGKAEGADQSFQKGMETYLDRFDVDRTSRAQIFIPWKSFNADSSVSNEWDVWNIPAEAFDMAEKVHPAWENCSAGVRKLHARNVCQILGQDLKSPSKFVLFYSKEVNGVIKGGTATAVSLANYQGIPSINMYFSDWQNLLSEQLINSGSWQCLK